MEEDLSKEDEFSLDSLGNTPLMRLRPCVPKDEIFMNVIDVPKKKEKNPNKRTGKEKRRKQDTHKKKIIM